MIHDLNIINDQWQIAMTYLDARLDILTELLEFGHVGRLGWPVNDETLLLVGLGDL
jgi:hypothetical protein